MRNKIFSLLVLLMTAATGAWATPNSIVINGTPQVGDKSISLTYHFDPANVPGIESYAPTLKVKCAADNKWDEIWLDLFDVSSGTTNISLDNLGEFEAGKTYEVCFAYNNGSWVDEVFQSFVPAAPATTTNYYLIGSMNDWCPSKQFQLTQNLYNTNEYMITLTLKEGDAFKVIGVDGEGNWAWYPGGSAPNYVVSATGEYTVYCRHDGQGGDGWYYGCLYLDAAPAPAVPVTDLGNNTWQFTMPDYAVVAKIEYDTDLELREENVNTTLLADWDGYEANINLKRTLQPGSWNTLTMPYDVSTSFLNQLKDYYHITAVKELDVATFENGTLDLKFKDATSLEAGKPYLVMLNSALDFSKLAVTDVVKATPKPFTSTNVDFIPTLGKTLITGPEGDESNEKAVLFLAAGNKLVNPTVVNDPAKAASYMKGFRAYFRLKGDALNAASFNLDFGNGETTGISSLTSEPSSNGEGSIYSLDGRRLNGKPAQKGVYIVNGKKMVIK